MATEVREIRALPIWLLREYLEDAGGRSAGDGSVEGAGWTARLTQVEDYRIGSLAVGQVRLEIEADEKALSDLLARLEPKLLRAGG
jgi:hypothetical protein